MSTLLTGLKIVSAKRPIQSPPIVKRRLKLSNQIAEQSELAIALNDGKQYAPKILKQYRNKTTGEVVSIEKVKRIRQWWFVAENGKICLQLRYGSRIIEFVKGKNCIEVSDAKDLIKTLSTLKIAVENGELDTQIEIASNAVKERFLK